MLSRTTFAVFTLLVLFEVVAGQQSAAKEADLALSFGNPKAENRIEVFYDFQCGSCATFHASLRRLVERFPERAFVIVRHFPLPLHDRAFMASSVVEAAKRQGKGMEMVDLLLQEQSKWSTAARSFPLISKYATQVGLDLKRFQKDLTSDDVILFVLRDHSRGKRLEVDSTPTGFLNGRKLTYPELLELEEFISKGN